MQSKVKEVVTMSYQRTIYGITADLANEFSPEQWVNLYQLDPVLGEEELHFWRKCQVKEIPDVLGSAALSRFAVEPLDDQGNVISVQQALDESG
jgi:hypothetical protein